MNGFFLVDKPKAMTSQQVVNQIKRRFQLHKCGHNGTLDPNATGLMVVACDEATKLMKYLVSHDKSYQTTLVFGLDSDTLDCTGKILKDEPMNFTKEDLESALNVLLSQEEQIPPLYAAIKVDGKKLYEYARKEKEVPLTARKVQLFDVQLLGDLRIVNGHIEADLYLHCSKGYYVRSFARDLGRLLHGCCIMKELKRTSSGRFELSKATSLDLLKEENLFSILDFFPEFDRLFVNDFTAHLALNGVLLDERQIKTEKPFYVVHKNVIIAIYEVVDVYKYKPLIIFKNQVSL